MAASSQNVSRRTRAKGGAVRTRAKRSVAGATRDAAKSSKPAAAASSSSAAPAAAASGTTAIVPDPVRSRIVATARAHFLPLGFARFTMDDLAAELGMSKKTLYAQFRSKHELIDAVIDAKSVDFFAGFEEVFADPERTFAQRVAHLIRHGTTQAREISMVFLRDLRRFAPTSYARLEAIRAQRIPAVWERLLAEGIASGAVRPEIDPRVTAQLILVAMQALLLPENLERLQLQPSELLGRFINLIFAGLVTPAGREDYEKHRALFST